MAIFVVPALIKSAYRGESLPFITRSLRLWSQEDPVHIGAARATRFGSAGRVTAGIRARSVVSIRRIPATVLDLTGVKAAGLIPGTSLAAVASETSPALPGQHGDVLERHPLGHASLVAVGQG